MRDLRDILPGKTDRALFVGQTGSGKTTLAKAILSTRPYVVIHDGKGEIDWPGYTRIERVSDLRKVRAKETPRIIYRPNRAEWKDAEAQAAFFDWIYQRQNTCLYVDEVYAVTDVDPRPEAFLACLTRGRSRGVVVYNSTQRPHWIPMPVISEAEHHYVFRLTLDRDRRRMEEIAGVPEGKIGTLPKHQFYYSQVGEGVHGPMTLALGA